MHQIYVQKSLCQIKYNSVSPGWYGAMDLVPDQLNPQPRYVLRPGMEPVTFLVHGTMRQPTEPLGLGYLRSLECYSAEMVTSLYSHPFTNNTCLSSLIMAPWQRKVVLCISLMSLHSSRWCVLLSELLFSFIHFCFELFLIFSFIIEHLLVCRISRQAFLFAHFLAYIPNPKKSGSCDSFLNSYSHDFPA